MPIWTPAGRAITDQQLRLLEPLLHRRLDTGELTARLLATAWHENRPAHPFFRVMALLRDANDTGLAHKDFRPRSWTTEWRLTKKGRREVKRALRRLAKAP